MAKIHTPKVAPRLQISGDAITGFSASFVRALIKFLEKKRSEWATRDCMVRPNNHATWSSEKYPAVETSFKYLAEQMKMSNPCTGNSLCYNDACSLLQSARKFLSIFE